MPSLALKMLKPLRHTPMWPSGVLTKVPVLGVGVRLMRKQKSWLAGVFGFPAQGPMSYPGMQVQLKIELREVEQSLPPQEPGQ